MSNLDWLTEARIERLKPFFPKSHGTPRFDDRRVLHGLIFVNRDGLRWCDGEGMNAIGQRECRTGEYGPAMTLHNRWKPWTEKGVFARIMAGLAAEDAE